MRTIFSGNRKNLFYPKFTRVCQRRGEGPYFYYSHGSRAEREEFEDYHKPEWKPLYRINVYPTGKIQ